LGHAWRGCFSTASVKENTAKIVACLPIAHHRDGRSIPIEILPHVRASLAAGFAHEPCFQIGEPDVIGPAVSVDLAMMGALVVAAIDQQPTHAAFAAFRQR
jgi:hypothetical protein